MEGGGVYDLHCSHPSVDNQEVLAHLHAVPRYIQSTEQLRAKTVMLSKTELNLPHRTKVKRSSRNHKTSARSHETFVPPAWSHKRWQKSI